jgi:hypothetical protein
MADDVQDSEEWPIVKVVESDDEAVLAAGFLRSRGIPATIESLRVEELPVRVGGLGEIRIRVPPGRLSEALAFLTEVEERPPETEPR